MSFRRRWPICLIGLSLFLVLVWFLMSGVDYHGGDEFLSLTTAGWFVLGFPFIAAFGIAYGLVFALIGIKTRFWFGWLLLLGITIPLVVYTARQALPRNRLKSILGPDVIAIAAVESLREQDSFNDGTFMRGVLSGPPKLLDLIVRNRKLNRQVGMSLSSFQSAFRDDAFPDYGDAYSDERSAFYCDAERGRIYFLIPFRH